MTFPALLSGISHFSGVSVAMVDGKNRYRGLKKGDYLTRQKKSFAE